MVCKNCFISRSDLGKARTEIKDLRIALEASRKAICEMVESGKSEREVLHRKIKAQEIEIKELKSCIRYYETGLS